MPLDDFKRFLFIETDRDDLDESLKSARGAAIDRVERDLDTALIAEEVVILAPRPDDGAPILIPFADVSGVVEIRFFQASQAHTAEAPAGVIQEAALGRFDSDGLLPILYPPAAGWPEIIEGSALRVKVKRDALPANGGRAGRRARLGGCGGEADIRGPRHAPRLSLRFI